MSVFGSVNLEKLPRSPYDNGKLKKDGASLLQLGSVGGEHSRAGLNNWQVAI